MKRPLTHLAILTCSFVYLADAAQSAPPEPFSIRSFAVNGTGCNEGSVATNVSQNGDALTVLFDDFVVEATPSEPLASKVCDIKMQLNVPSGWSIAFVTADTRGYASLEDEESIGRVRSLYAFTRTREPFAVIDEKFVGPLDQDYELRNEDELEALEWSPCGGRRGLHLRTRIMARLKPRSQNGGSLITVDSIDHAVVQTFAVKWQRCQRDDQPDRGDPTALRQSKTATCEVKLVNRRGRILRTFEGHATGIRPRLVKERALAKAIRKCEQRSELRPNASCENARPRDCDIEES